MKGERGKGKGTREIGKRKEERGNRKKERGKGEGTREIGKRKEKRGK